jgi:hypothetical protein
VRIRACPLDEHQPYREPLPLQERERFTGRGTGELYTYDPEDHAGEQDPEPVKPRQRAAFLR